VRYIQSFLYLYYCDWHNTQLAPHSSIINNNRGMNLTFGSCHLLATNYKLNVLQLSLYLIKEKKVSLLESRFCQLDPFSLAGGETCNKSYPQSGMFRVRNVAPIWSVVFQEADSIGKWVFSLDCCSCWCCFQEGLYLRKNVYIIIVVISLCLLSLLGVLH